MRFRRQVNCFRGFGVFFVAKSGRHRSAAPGAILGREFHDFKGFRRHLGSFARASAPADGRRL